MSKIFLPGFVIGIVASVIWQNIVSKGTRLIALYLDGTSGYTSALAVSSQYGIIAAISVLIWYMVRAYRQLSMSMAFALNLSSMSNSVIILGGVLSFEMLIQNGVKGIESQPEKIIPIFAGFFIVGLLIALSAKYIEKKHS